MALRNREGRKPLPAAVRDLNQRVGDWMLSLTHDARLGEKQLTTCPIDRRLLSREPLRIAPRLLPITYKNTKPIAGPQFTAGLALMRKHNLLDWVTADNNKQNLQNAVMACVELSFTGGIDTYQGDNYYTLSRGTLRCDGKRMYCLGEWGSEHQQCLDISWAKDTKAWPVVCWMVRKLTRNGVMSFPIEHCAERMQDTWLDEMSDNKELAEALKEEDWMQPWFDTLIRSIWKNQPLASVRRSIPKELVNGFDDIARMFQRHERITRDFLGVDVTDGDMVEECMMHPIYWLHNSEHLTEEIDADIDNYYSNYIILGGWREVNLTPDGIELVEHTDKFVADHIIRSTVLTWLEELRKLS